MIREGRFRASNAGSRDLEATGKWGPRYVTWVKLTAAWLPWLDLFYIIILVRSVVSLGMARRKNNVSDIQIASDLSDKYQSYNRLREELGMYIDVFQSVGQTSLHHFNLEHGWPLDFPTVDVAG